MELQKNLSAAETADFLGVTTHTLATWRYTKRYNLPYIKIGKMILYRIKDINHFLDEHTHNSGNFAA